MKDCFRSSTGVRSGEQISLPDVNDTHCDVCKYSYMSDRGLPPAGPRPGDTPADGTDLSSESAENPATSVPPTLGRTRGIVNACGIVFGPLHGASQGGGKTWLLWITERGMGSQITASR